MGMTTQEQATIFWNGCGMSAHEKLRALKIMDKLEASGSASTLPDYGRYCLKKGYWEEVRAIVRQIEASLETAETW